MELTLEQAAKLMAEDGGNLDLRGKPVTKLPDGLTVNGFLDLSGTPIAELPKNLTVKGSLAMYDAPLAELPAGLRVGNDLVLNDTPITSIPADLLVNGSLGLRRTRVAELPDHFTVGGCCDLCETPIAKLPRDLIIGKTLFIDNTGITRLPDDIVTGNGICAYEQPIPEAEVDAAKRLKHGDYVPGRYIFANGTLTLVRSERHLGGYTIYTGKVPGKHVVTDGRHYSHCRRLKNALVSLAFEDAKDKGANQYKGFPMDAPMTVTEAKVMYRTITGACQEGIEDFVANLGNKLKDRYTVREMLEITKGQYGHGKLEAFFAA